MRGASLALAMALATGCSSQAQPVRIDPLSGTASFENAGRIAEMVRRFCVEASTDQEFATALKASGLAARQTQRGDPGDSLSFHIWRIPHASIVRSAQNEGMWICSIAVDRRAAPSSKSVSAALNRVADGAAQSEETGWQWKPTPFHQVNMTIGSSAISSPGETLIHVEGYKLSPLKAFLGG